MPRVPTPKLLIIGDETVHVAIPRVRQGNIQKRKFSLIKLILSGQDGTPPGDALTVHLVRTLYHPDR
jgi:hypothetical protein